MGGSDLDWVVTNRFEGGGGSEVLRSFITFKCRHQSRGRSERRLLLQPPVLPPIFRYPREYARDGQKLACGPFVDEWWQCGHLPSLETAMLDNFCGGSTCVRPTPVVLFLPPALVLTERPSDSFCLDYMSQRVSQTKDAHVCGRGSAGRIRPQSARGANRQRAARHEPCVWSVSDSWRENCFEAILFFRGSTLSDC